MSTLHLPRWDGAISVWNQRSALTHAVETGQSVPLTWGPHWVANLAESESAAPANRPLGYVAPQLAEQLANRYPRVFSRAETVCFARDFALDAKPNRTAMMAEVMRDLASQGVLLGWREERVHVSARFGGEPLFDIERASSRVLGLVAFASHLNGFVSDGAQDHLWLATRSSKKTVDPGKFDNMVGGRISAGHTALATMHKEAWEEAGVPPELAADIRATGAIALCYATPDGWHRELLFTHDLQLPADFTPVSMDGEVARFDRFDIATLAPLTCDPRMTLDAAAVSVDWLIRRGQIPAEHPDYWALQRALRCELDS
jgi:8-oxo-dGTP pyrophosphatase MutT (NUDIX family)